MHYLQLAPAVTWEPMLHFIFQQLSEKEGFNFNCSFHTLCNNGKEDVHC